MKRKYKYSSILWILLIVGLTNYLLARLILAIGNENFVATFLADLITGIISFIFTFSISSGLIRNRMGSVGDYLNQVNYLNMKVLTVGFVIAIVEAIGQYLFVESGTYSIFSAIVSPNNDSVFAIGSIILPIIGFIITIIIAIFFAYTNFYLADHYDTEDGVMTIIGKIFIQGKRLFKKTLILGLKWEGIPLLVYILCLGFLFFVNDEYVGWGLFAFFSIAYVITALIIAIIFIARLSDIYLDDKLEIEE